MRYRPFGAKTDVLVSMLGFGAMRLPMTEGRIDLPRALEVMETGFHGGINYVDTAYAYNDGESEKAVGAALANGWRDKVYVATKLPTWNLARRATRPRCSRPSWSGWACRASISICCTR
jgi:predicted aldo/keto reductase-like oxidoreductase